MSFDSAEGTERNGESCYIRSALTPDFQTDLTIVNESVAFSSEAPECNIVLRSV